ncbi:DNA double-strand break repair nuclease NurA [Stygiolobus caldivivus]|uniref:NurA domain-containing protein n=1 Tax=Stygiolobus caldivivus TaxID=2824673 RepID=A0A8D5U9S3_9CREN|nr:DNA double-strand break repair nuclease NurA [Stygiolobus caldivivus]BCU71483.1 hypothetical protein KN1_27800 [Stygiolobus caldivivus]
MSKSEADIQYDLLKLGVEISKLKDRATSIVHTYTPRTDLGDDKENLQLLSDKIETLDLFSLKGDGSSVASVDSSSRMLRTTFLDLVVVGGALYSTDRDRLIYPFDVSGRYIGVASYLEFLRILQKALNTVGIATANVVGYEFAVDEVEVETKEGIRRESLYHLDDVADELRLEAENNLIRQATKEKLLILDGPLFPTPIELSSSFQFGLPKDRDVLKHWGRITHRWAYATLIKERLDMIKSRDVIGVVKRLENSRKLRQISGIGKFIGINRVPDLTDAELLELISEKQCNSTIGLCLIGPIRIVSEIDVKRDDIDQVIINAEDIPERYAYYAILKIPGGIQTFFRIEGLNLSVLNNSLQEVFSGITKEMLPTYISFVDNYSKKVTKGLFYLSFNVLKDFITFLHDTKLEALNISQEINSGLV